jgi:hypothetical protein
MLGAGGAVRFNRPRAAHAALGSALAVVALALALQPRPSAAPDRPTASAESPSLTFVENAGQTDASVRFVAGGASHAFYFTPDKAVLDLRRGERGVALELRFRGASPDPQIVAERHTSARVSYIDGAERHPNLATYEQIRYRSLWPGIDMVFRGQGGQLKYEFLVRPGGDPRDIRLAYAGADSLRLAGNGALSIATPLGSLRDTAPTARQGHRGIDARYALSGVSYGFTVKAYDRSRPLLIDPGLAYSTYLGGENDAFGDDAFEWMKAIDVDAQGNAYAVGETTAVDFPTTPGAYDTSSNGGGFVSKLNPDGGLVYSTYLGSAQLNDVAVDESGHAYIFGGTSSEDFPTTEGAYRRTGPPEPEFEAVNLVVKLSPDGSDLVFSTFIGVASANFGSIDVLDGRAYVAGLTLSSTYPTTPGAFDTSHDGHEGYVTKLNPTGSALEYSTLLNGTIFDNAVDGAGQVLLTGQASGGLPTTPGAYDTTNGGVDAFAAKLNAGGTGLIFSTYLGGGSEDRARAIDFDAAGNVYVTGWTANVGFPTTPGAYAPTKIGNGFAAKFDPAGTSLLYSTYLAGNWAIGWERGIDVDPAGFAWIAGYVESWQQPLETTPDAYDATLDGEYGDAYVVKLTPSGDSLAYSSYLGGSSGEIGVDLKLDAFGNAYVAGRTYSTDFPITPGAADPVLTVSEDGFNEDGFVTKFDMAQFSGYARPKGATPAYFSLTTAYEPCADPNEIHGPPLAFGSCGGPQMTSAFLTVGTGDSNGMPARNEGYVALKVLTGNPATPADEADVQISLFSDDIFTKTLADYTGELRAQFDVRITDKNSPGPRATTAGTTTDIPIAAVFGCTPVADPQEGSVCSATTSMDALIPGAVAESKRSIWQLGQMRVFDGGADGDGDTVGDNTLFATAGVFVP